MPSTRELRRRIRSVQNTAKVTKAMQMIAASKMRRAQQMVLNGRPYSERIRDVLADLVAQPTEEEAPPSPLLEVRPEHHTLMLLVTPDRGLCGGLVANINRAAAQTIRDSESPVTTITVGRKGQGFMVRIGADLKATFSVSDRPSLEETTAISRMLIDEFESHQADRVLIAYSEFVSTAVQRPVVRTLIPVEPAELEQERAVGYIYEPDPQTVLQQLLPRYVEMQVYYAILEAIASEQSARMVAMKNATDNANELVEDLTLEMNKVRQESITNELLDIVGGVAAAER